MAIMVITGASQRLGLFMTSHYANELNHIFAITRRASAELLALPSERVSIVEVGDYNSAGAAKAASRIAARTDRVDVLINNASLFQPDAMHANAETEAFFSALFSTHMLFPYSLVMALKPLLSDVEEPGSVINITDIYAANPNPEYTLYCATKAGLDNMTMSLAKTLAGLVRVNSIAPGPIKFLPSHSEADRDKVLDQTLVRKEGGFSAVLQATELLIHNDYMTGTTIKVDGGRSIYSG